VEPAGQRRQVVRQVDVVTGWGLPGLGLELCLFVLVFVVQFGEVRVNPGPQGGSRRLLAPYSR